MTSAPDIARRVSLLRAEIRRRMSIKEKWTGLPGLLDEMHRLRLQLRSSTNA